MNIEEYFRSVFDDAPAAVAYAPGRVNLIGEHTDYNGGMVLPAALPIGIEVAIRPRSDDRICVASSDFDGVIEASLSSKSAGGWADYAIGGALHAKAKGLLTGGVDIAVRSSMPYGGGLSSSAALIVAVLKAARKAAGAQIDDRDIAILARAVETDFIGVPVGIMDQMAVAVAAPGFALALDTKTLDFEPIALPDAFHMAVVHSGFERELKDGRYAARKTECDAARDALAIDDICLLSDDELAHAQLDAPLDKRVRHCVSEHRRTRAAAHALKSGAMEAFGALMNESHASMRDDFEMSLAGIDALVDDARRTGAIGARLTGGGFGGCIVACVPKTALEQWTKDILAKHPQAYFVC